MFPLNLNTLPAGAQELISELALEPIALYGENDYGRLWYKFADCDELRTMALRQDEDFERSRLSFRPRNQRCSDFIRRPLPFLEGDFYQLSLF